MSEEQRKPFYVDAGKLESNDEVEYERTGEQFYRNYKYCDQFATLDEAMKAAKTCEGYHFIDLTFEAADGKRYELQLNEITEVDQAEG